MNRLSDYMQAQHMTDEMSKLENGVWYSEPEIRLREALVERGFRFVQQYRVTCGRTTAVLDFLVCEELVVEVDGREFHDASKDARRDDQILRKHGFWTLRVSGWKVMRDPGEVVSLIALKLSELGIDVRTVGNRAALVVGALQSELVELESQR